MLHDIIFEQEAKRPNAYCIHTKEQKITYGDLAGYTRGFAEGMQKYNLNEGDRIMILLPNIPSFVIALFGISYLGCVALLADTKFNQEIDQMMRENNIKYIITDYVNKIKVVRSLKRLKEDGAALANDEYHIIEVEKEENLFSHKIPSHVNNDWQKPIEHYFNKVALVLYTSGSTGCPKGVIHTHGSLLEALRNYSETVAVFSEDRFLAVTPFFHSYAFGSCLLNSLYHGAVLYLEDTFIPRRIMTLIENEKLTVFHGVPYMYHLILEQLEYLHQLDSLRLCISAGCQLSRLAAEKFYQNTGKVIHQEYGSSETGTMAINLSDDLESNILSVGKPLENVECSTVNKDGMDGLLKVSSKGCFYGYVNEKPRNTTAYLTNDLIKRDENGYIYLVGRANRLINVAGLKVNPEEIERYLLSHPQIEDVVARGRADESMGQIIEVIIVKKNPVLSYKEVIDYCHLRLASYKVPQVIKWAQEITRSSMGKMINYNREVTDGE